MLPHDLPGRPFPIPPGDRDTAVLVTGDRPRHERFGYLLQARCPSLLRDWWVLEPPAPRPAVSANAAVRMMGATYSARSAVRALKRGQVGDLTARIGRAGRSRLQRGLRAMRTSAARAREREELAGIEADMFGADLARLRGTAAVHPVRTESTGPTDVSAGRPFFVLFYDVSPLSMRALRAQGLTLSLNVGWLPVVDEPATVEGALYHREPARVASTVLTVDQASGEPSALRRSSATLHPEDTVARCVLAAHAAGHDLLIDVVQRAGLDDEMLAFALNRPVPSSMDTDASSAMSAGLERDFAAGWLGDALRDVRDF